MSALIALCAFALGGVIPLEGRVTDKAGAVAPSTAARLEQKLIDYERDTGHQFAVLVVPNLGGQPIERYALEVVEHAELGDKLRDDGLLVLVAMQEREVRVEVGYGLEGVITDARASRVIRDTMAPLFVRGDYAGGIEAGLDALMQAAAGEATGAAPVVDENRPGGFMSRVGFFTLLLFLLLSVLSRFMRRSRFARHIPAPIFFPFPLGGIGRHSDTIGGLGGGGSVFSGGGGGFGGGGASGRW